MANRQIFQLDSKVIVSTDVFPVQDESGSAEAKKVTLQNIIDAVPADPNKVDVSTYNAGQSAQDDLISANATGITANTSAISGKLDSVVGGTDIQVDNTDPNNPVINFTGSSGGGSVQSQWKYSTGGGVPASGRFTTNSTAPASVGTININDTNDNGYDLSNILNLLTTGDTIYLQDLNDPTAGGIYQISTITDNTTYYTFGVTIVDAGTTAFTNNSSFGFIFTNTSPVSTSWGSITGTLSDQTDLQTALDAKADKNLSINSQSGAYSVVEADNGKTIECDGTFTLTFPTGLTTGFQVLIANVGTGTITLAADGTLQTKDSNTKISSQWAGVTAYHRGSDNIVAFGDLTA